MVRLRAAATVMLSALLTVAPVCAPAAFAEDVAAGQEQLVDALSVEVTDEPVVEGVEAEPVEGDAVLEEHDALAVEDDVIEEDEGSAPTDPVTDDEAVDASEVEAPAEEAEEDVAEFVAANSWRYADGVLVEDAAGAKTVFSVDALALPEGATARGIDVNEANGEINWDAVAEAGVDFAIIRMGSMQDGVWVADAQWERNVAECERVGIAWGAYVYGLAQDAEQATVEAEQAISALGGYSPDLPVFYDLEDETLPEGVLDELAQAFCSAVDEAGYQAGVYAPADWWGSRLTDEVAQTWCAWVADYTDAERASEAVRAQQFTAAGEVPGVTGQVGLSFWYGDPFEAIELAATADVDELAQKYADEIPDGVYAIVSNDAGRKVLDVAAGSSANGANVQIYASNATNAQRWRVSHDEDGFLTITCVGSGKVLDVNAGKAKAGTNVQQYQSNGTRAQKWVAVPVGDTYKLMSALGESLVLDVSAGSTANGANIQIYTDNGTAAQRFRFVSAEPTVEASGDSMPAGWFVLEPASAAGFAVDVASASNNNGANVQLYKANGTMAQMYTFESVDGFYQIRAAHSGKVLDVDSGDVVPGANVQQWDSNATNRNAQFAAIDNGDGTWSFVNRASGLALTAMGSSNCANVAVTTYGPTAAQRFTLKAVDHLIAEGIYSLSMASSTKYVIDVASASCADSAQIQLYGSNSTFAQRWRIDEVDGKDNTYTIESLNSGKRLAATGASSIGQRDPSNDISQQWVPTISKGAVVFESAAYEDRVIAAAAIGNSQKLGLVASNASGLCSFKLTSSNDTIPNGSYFIRMASAPGTVLDVASGSTANGANVQVYAKNNSLAQKWDITRNSDGTYTILSAVSGKALDVQGGSASSGTNVQQYTKNGSAAQKWRITYSGGGFKITSALSSKLVLDVNGGSSANFSNVQIYTDNGSRGGQRFTFEKTSYTPVYRGWQNPKQYYQVSNVSVTIPHQGQGIFGYRTTSRISIDATKQDCINAMITRAYDYIGTPYIWDYSCAPGVGVDCAGLVMQCLYACGMDLSPMNPWDHYYTPGHDQYANYMWTSGRFQRLSFSQRKVGDLVCYPGHIAIYIGNDRIIEAWPGAGVRTANVYHMSGIRGVLRPFV